MLRPFFSSPLILLQDKFQRCQHKAFSWSLSGFFLQSQHLPFTHRSPLLLIYTKTTLIFLYSSSGSSLTWVLNFTIFNPLCLQDFVHTHPLDPRIPSYLYHPIKECNFFFKFISPLDFKLLLPCVHELISLSQGLL